MKLFDEDIQEYIQLVKKLKGKDIDVQTAQRDFRNLLLIVAKIYLPKEVQKMFEINSE